MKLMKLKNRQSFSYIHKGKLGFTLIEIMIATSISAVILGTVFYFLIAGERYLETINTRTTLQQDLRRVAGEIRENLCKACYYHVTGNNRHLKIHIPGEYTEGHPSSYKSIHYKIKKNRITRNNDLILNDVSLLTDFSEIKELKFGVLKLFLRGKRKSRRGEAIKADISSFIYSRNSKLGHRCDKQKKHKD